MPEATPRLDREVRRAMIYILLGVPFYLPEETKLEPVIYRDGDFLVHLLQPAQSLWQAEDHRGSFGLAQMLPTSEPRPSQVTFNGSKTTVCDLLCLEVVDASEDNIDDAVDAAIRTANRWLRTYRVSLGAHPVRYVGRNRCSDGAAPTSPSGIPRSQRRASRRTTSDASSPPTWSTTVCLSTSAPLCWDTSTWRPPLGYVAVFEEDLIRHYQAFLDRRRSRRPNEEYRPATDAEWKEFQQHFDKRKVELGSCGRPYGTPCVHEHACVRCPMLYVTPTSVAGQSSRLRLSTA
jgi:hypothetical protein